MRQLFQNPRIRLKDCPAVRRKIQSCRQETWPSRAHPILHPGPHLEDWYAVTKGQEWLPPVQGREPRRKRSKTIRGASSRAGGAGEAAARSARPECYRHPCDSKPHNRTKHLARSDERDLRVATAPPAQESSGRAAADPSDGHGAGLRPRATDSVPSAAGGPKQREYIHSETTCAETEARNPPR